MELLLLLLLAHLAADFLLQTEGMVADRGAGRLPAYLKHAAGHAAALVLLTHYFYSPALLLLWIALPSAHVLLDWIKDRLFPPGRPAESLVFLLDQSLHLLLIFFAWQWVPSLAFEPAAVFYGRLLAPPGRELLETLFPSATPARLLLLVVVYGYVLAAGSVLIRKVLDAGALSPPGSGGGSRRGDALLAGRYIGYLERAIILSLTLAGAFTSIAFVLAAKSIARYKELENKDFAEYYLVGTLLSALLAILGGLLLKGAAIL
ncbi:MAG TPA: DUF3307 domain-containing protein [Bacillota bacterium]|jgi:hypothetical protein|nr:DUF3307 domain-containing protein [Bacillota bacterium]HOB86968.1 DUF3307 domain-containing protein [Bacillota bacterium]HOP68622.1 DUF3307 domain-containing protein [Bacillota bacterium]HPT34022.1 DUF3307 domain-containing protein [Bacillota bacterium]HQD06036.1 DUF3307 domain-containing protein [Bacillota bacterium]